MMKKVLVIDYSWSNGNTKRIAERLAAALGADLDRIETLQPYTGSDEEVPAQGKKEGDSGFQPQLKPLSFLPMTSSPSAHRPGGIRWRRLFVLFWLSMTLQARRRCRS